MLSKSYPTVRDSYKVLNRNLRAGVKALPTLGNLRTFTLVAALLVFVALVNLAQFSSAAMIARNLQLKQVRIAELKEENAQLRFEIAAATAPGTIESRAKKLGLGPATNIVYTSLPALHPDRAQPVPAFEMGEQPAVTTAVPAPWDQILSLFGIDNSSGRAQAQSK